ncbi:MAG: glycosyltransferase family 39 protein [Acidobacteriota bacterium]|nr:glycosyltransferase family 39 protein [Acidobacteriota bacterium]
MEEDIRARLSAAEPPAPLDRRDAAAVGTLLVFPLAAYAPVLSQWWTGDDTQIVRHALSHPLREILTFPAAWRDLTWLYFTPQVTVAARLDMALFGLNPRGWYAHHLLVLGAAAALLYVLVCRASGRIAAFLAALLLLLGPPTAEVSRQLYSRHYAAGLAFSLAALLLYRAAVARRSWGAAAAAAGAVLLAMLCKEVFAAVPFVALAWPCGARRERARFAIPLFAALAAYLPWRHAMVGWWGGVRDAGEPLRRAAEAVAGFPGAIAGLPQLAGAVLLVVALVLLRPTLEEAAAIAVTAAVVVGPLTLLRDAPAGRYAFAPLAAAAALAGVAAGRGLRSGGPRRALAAALLLGILVPAVLKNRALLAAASPVQARSRAEGRFAFERSAPGDVLYRPADPAWFFDGLGWMRAFEGRGTGGTVLFDGLPLCDAALRPRVFVFDAESGRVERAAASTALGFDADCARLDRTMRLSGSFTYRDSVLKWRLAPDEGGSWTLLSGDSASPFAVPREGTYFILVKEVATFRVRHEAADGRLGLGPTVTLRVRGGEAEASFVSP